MSESIELELYVVQNQEGKFFRSKGYSGYGDTWVDNVQNAKIYTKLSQARSRVTWFYNTYPKYGIPNILKLGINTVEILDEKDRVLKAVNAKRVREDRFHIRQAEHALKRSKDELDRAQRNYEQAQRNMKN